MANTNCDLVNTGTTITISDPVDYTTCEHFPCLAAMIRVYLDDLSATQFTDQRIAELIRAAQFYVGVDLKCCQYVETPGIGNCGFLCFDPAEFPEYTQLLVLKAVCIVDMGVARAKAAAEGLRAVCGPASLTVNSSNSIYDYLSTGGFCGAYSELKEDLCFRQPLQCAQHCFQIVSMFTNKNGPYNCYVNNYRVNAGCHY